MDVIDRLLQFCSEKDFSQTQFSCLIKMEQKTVNNYFNRSRKVSYEFIEKIIRTFGLDANWLITGSGERAESDESQQSDNHPSHNVKISSSSAHLDEENKSLQKKVISLMEENMALQKKVISLMEENKKLNDYDSDDDNTDRLGMYQKMLEERIEKLRRNKKRTDSA